MFVVTYSVGSVRLVTRDKFVGRPAPSDTTTLIGSLSMVSQLRGTSDSSLVPTITPTPAYNTNIYIDIYLYHSQNVKCTLTFSQEFKMNFVMAENFLITLFHMKFTSY